LIIYLYDGIIKDACNNKKELFAIYYKRNNKKYVDYLDKIGLYDDKINKVVFFPKNLKYIDFKK